jgi:alpha-amylase/alpha-mannosidase (GH57 family)
MSGDAPLNVVICWHMHQPQYCDLISGTYQLPWSYLHAIKDYIDMAAHSCWNSYPTMLPR